jgi:hypothetical protein
VRQYSVAADNDGRKFGLLFTHELASYDLAAEKLCRLIVSISVISSPIQGMLADWL